MVLSAQIQPTLCLSKPANPSSRSFLTLNGEIRNSVYEALFCVEGDIKMVFDGYNCDTRHSGTTTISGTSFLLSCRQVYTEAAGVLYGANVIAFSESDGCYSEIPCKKAADWLAKIGANACSVNCLIIHVAEDPGFSHFIYVLPMLKQLWQQDGSNLRITFRQVEPSTGSLNASMLNKALSLLEVDAVLKIRSLARFSKLLEAVCLHITGRAGLVYYYRPEGSYPFLETYIEFNADEHNIYPTRSPENESL
jgi:hypothetical protein